MRRIIGCDPHASQQTTVLNDEKRQPAGPHGRTRGEAVSGFCAALSPQVVEERLPSCPRVKLDIWVEQLISRAHQLASYRSCCPLTGSGPCGAQRSMLCTGAADWQEKAL